MRVGCADQDMLFGDTRFFRDLLAGCVTDGAMNSQEISDHDSELGLAVIKHQTTRVQFVVDVLRRVRRKTTDDVATDRRRDIAGGSAGPQTFGSGCEREQNPE